MKKQKDENAVQKQVQAIEHPEIVRGLAKSGGAIISELTSESMHALHMAVGIAGEVGELLDAIEQAESGCQTNINIINVIEECGDIEFYAEGLRQGFDIDRKQTLLVVCDVSKSSLINAVRLSVAASEILDSIKKFAVYNKPCDVDQLIHQLGKLERLMDALRTGYDITREKCIAANIEKLGKRYKDFQYTNQAAQDRLDKIAG